MEKKSFEEMVESGVGRPLAAELVMKQAETPQEFLDGLHLLMLESMEREKGLIRLSKVQQQFHRHVKKVFGRSSLLDAIGMNQGISPVEAIQREGEGFYVIAPKSAPVVAESRVDEIKRQVKTKVIEMGLDGSSETDIREYVAAMRVKYSMDSFKD